MIYFSRYAERNEMWRTRNAADGVGLAPFLCLLPVSAAFMCGLIWSWVAFVICLFLTVLFFITPFWIVARDLLEVRKAWKKDMAEKAESLARDVLDS